MGARSGWRYTTLVRLERFAGKVQRLVDEYVGCVGSAAIVTRTGDVVFRSTHDDSAAGLAPTFDEVPVATLVGDEPVVVNLPIARAWCTYGVALDSRHVLFVIASRTVAPGVIATRMKKAATLLARVLAAGAPAPAPPSGGPTGAPALVDALGKPRG